MRQLWSLTSKFVPLQSSAQAYQQVVTHTLWMGYDTGGTKIYIHCGVRCTAGDGA